MPDYIRVSEATEATDAQMTDTALMDVAIVNSSSSTGFSTRKTPLSKLANYILNKFNTLSLGGAARTVKSAIDAIKSVSDTNATNISTINTKIGSTIMGTTATTLTGAIAEVNDSINSKFIDVDVSSQVNIPFTAIEKSIIKRGDKVRVHVELNLTSFIANYNYTLWTMPTSLRPKYPVFAACYQTDSNYLNTGLVTVGLRANGNVQATFENATSSYVFIEFEYTLAQS